MGKTQEQIFTCLKIFFHLYVNGEYKNKFLLL